MKLFVNRSNEWLQTFSAISFARILDEDRDLAADDFTNALANGLESAGFEAVVATGQYGSCHGWNGANTFETMLGPVASHEKLSEEMQSAIRGIIARAEAAMRRDWIELAVDE